MLPALPYAQTPTSSTHTNPEDHHLPHMLHFPFGLGHKTLVLRHKKFTDKRGKQSPSMGEDGPQVSSFPLLGPSLIIKEGPLKVGGEGR